MFKKLFSSSRPESPILPAVRRSKPTEGVVRKSTDSQRSSALLMKKLDLSLLQNMFPLSLPMEDFVKILSRIANVFVFSELTWKHKHYQYCFKACDFAKAIEKDEAFAKMTQELVILFAELLMQIELIVPLSEYEDRFISNNTIYHCPKLDKPMVETLSIPDNWIVNNLLCLQIIATMISSVESIKGLCANIEEALGTKDLKSSLIITYFVNVYGFTRSMGLRFGQCLEILTVFENKDKKHFYDDEVCFKCIVPKSIVPTSPLTLKYFEDDLEDELVGGSTSLLKNIGANTETASREDSFKKKKKPNLFQSESEMENLAPEFRFRNKHIVYHDMVKNEETVMESRTLESRVSSGKELGEILNNENPIVKSMVEKRKDEWIDKKPLKVMVATWNVAEKQTTEKLEEWLHITDQEPDIIAIGLQEIDMSAITVVVKEESAISAYWDLIIQGVVSSKKYKRVFSQQMVGIFSIIFVKRDLIKNCSLAFSTKIGTGELNGTFGNKGGIGLRFNIHETSLCFFACHFAAHSKEVAKRNQNFADIMKETAFEKVQYAPLNHDYIFVYGDLNYRLEMSYEECLEKIENKDIEGLLKTDQLYQEKKLGHVFEGFSEGKITFLPTYKYIKGSVNEYTTKQKRVPSYTDRIMYKSLDFKNLVKCHFYEAKTEYVVSDHKPVVALFEIDVSVKNTDKYEQIYADVLEKLSNI